MPECSQTGWFVLAWDEQTLILSLLHVSLESYSTLCCLLALIRPGIKCYEKMLLVGVEQKLVLCFSISSFSYSDTHGEDTVVTAIE